MIEIVIYPMIGNFFSLPLAAFITPKMIKTKGIQLNIFRDAILVTIINAKSAIDKSIPNMKSLNDCLI